MLCCMPSGRNQQSCVCLPARFCQGARSKNMSGHQGRAQRRVEGARHGGGKRVGGGPVCPATLVSCGSALPYMLRYGLHLIRSGLTPMLVWCFTTAHHSSPLLTAAHHCLPRIPCMALHHDRWPFHSAKPASHGQVTTVLGVMAVCRYHD